MIIPGSFQRAYDKHTEDFKKIKYEVDGILTSIAKERSGISHDSRIKSVEGVFIKSLTGRYSDPLNEMEDFFACVVTVSTLGEIPIIAEIIKQRFDVVDTKTRTFLPHEFRYSDLHLILRLKNTKLQYNKILLERKFELQIWLPDS